jgi:catechol 2,3-dioxygenase-like lactoylglutathione lyase family enzyme
VQVTRILHSSVNAHGSLEETRCFYAGVLGLDSTIRPEIPGIPGHWFAVGDAQIHLVGAIDAGRGIDPTGHHVCLAVTDLEAAVHELEEAGIAYASAMQAAVRQVWIVDPAGNTVELQQDPDVGPYSGDSVGMSGASAS